MRELRVGKALTSKRLRTLAVGVVVVVVDQITKLWAVRELEDGSITLIDGLLKLRLTENPGSAFSLFQNSGQFLAIAAIGATILILVTVEQSSSRFELGGMAIIMGGAVGNLVDRIVRADDPLDGAVVDFIDFSFWPTFNAADSAITIGAGLLLWAAIRSK